MSADPATVLKDFFGIQELKPCQHDVVEHVLAYGVSGEVTRDLVCEFPTGSGKSVCYLLPAVLRGWTILVISPLLSLIHDQQRQLNNNAAGVKIAFDLCDATNTAIGDESDPVPSVRILFCTPERLSTPGFLDKLVKIHQHTPFAYFTFDEAHLIVESGNTFRNDYLKVGLLRTAFPTVPILCFSATCNDFVKSELRSILKLRNTAVFAIQHEKTNLFLNVHSASKTCQHCQCGSKNCLWHHKSDMRCESIVKSVNFWGSGEVLVFCNSRSDVEKMHEYLEKMLPAKIVEHYHGAMQDSVRSEVQTRFVRGDTDILVATAASFGLGVNMILVSKVVCVGVPTSVQAISQMIGRGGRRGQQYYCDFYIKDSDLIKNKKMLEKESALVSTAYRKYMLDSFGAVEYLVANSYAHKDACLLNIILLGVNTTSTILTVPFVDLQDFKKKNATVRPCNRAKWNGTLKKWFLPPFATNPAVAQWNRAQMRDSILHAAEHCHKCSNCRKTHP
jgi:RecQ family ATP-dependent DNA helicase